MSTTNDDVEEISRISLLTRDEMIDEIATNNAELTRDWHYDFHRLMCVRGSIGTNLMTTRQIRDTLYDLYGVPKELHEHPASDETATIGTGLTVAGLVTALVNIVNDRPELAHAVPLMVHEMDNDLTFKFRVAEVAVRSYNRVELVGPQQNRLHPLIEPPGSRCSSYQVHRDGLDNKYCVQQCTHSKGHFSRHRWVNVGPIHDTRTDANRWLAANGGGFL